MFPQFKNQNKKTIVITTITPWNEPPRLRHQIANELSKNYNVLYIQTYPVKHIPPVKVTDSLITLSVGKWWKGIGLLFLFLPFFETLYKRIIVKKIHAIMLAYGFSKQSNSLINFNYDFKEIYELDVFRKKLFVCNDDFVAMERGAVRISRAKNRFKAVLESADVTFAVSSYLVDKCRVWSTNIHLLRHGVEYFESEKSIEKPCYTVGDPVNICYMGYINDRVAVEWIIEVLHDKQNWVWMIGPVESKGIKAQLLEYPQCRFLPPLYGGELINKLAEMDVLILPYAVGKLNDAQIKSLAPNKTFIYLNSGRPVVATDLPYLRELPNSLIYTAKDKLEFRGMIGDAIRNDSIEKRIERVEYAKANSWANRIKILEKHL